jgi:hypothetical protein
MLVTLALWLMAFLFALRGAARRRAARGDDLAAEVVPL